MDGVSSLSVLTIGKSHGFGIKLSIRISGDAGSVCWFLIAEDVPRLNWKLVSPVVEKEPKSKALEHR